MDLQVGGTYSFSVYPVAVLGTNFKNVLVMANLDAETAQALGLDILAKHAMISPSLPSTTAKDPTKYQYVKIKYPSGKTDILALEWIDASTISSVDLGTFTVIIGKDSSTRQQKLLDCLAANLFTVQSIIFNAGS